MLCYLPFDETPPIHAKLMQTKCHAYLTELCYSNIYTPNVTRRSEESRHTVSVQKIVTTYHILHTYHCIKNNNAYIPRT